ncbi:biotin--[acetyl-CoA-carboxylase] ligase [Pannonibacter tanglangensis]|uniref:biotin--[biotin carboxyl-carrier protein] ligase n=1 Tax=Pannonibacter tanglangensis TaxID=2750084 RepID=A0ABW9ZE60_9HYPH|nr:biotin--[acetyl-CoA-carboxylase] ligase [Pannonibacter sp. XCT-34]NBN62323.1 biotin--[acetyl-CoA-carboxylase] ligase [Pannonibacter sp. XCT-34]
MSALLAFGPVPQAPGFRFERHAALPSTNSAAMEAARAGQGDRLWVLADQQTAGRGRRGRSWSSPVGNLFASVLLIDPGPRARIGELPLVAAVALADAVDRAVGAFGLARLKWPNDLLVGEAKLSGILLEAEPLADGRLAVVCGFGVNCVTHPDPEHYAATDLAALGYRVEAEGMFACLAGSLAHWLDTWSRSGFAPVRSAWLQRALRLGEEITVRLPAEELVGRFKDIDPRGQLVLALAGGQTRTISAGDVFFGPRPER